MSEFIISAFACVGGAVVGGVLFSVGWYALDLWRASRRERERLEAQAKWNESARRLTRAAVGEMHDAESAPGETVIRW